MNCRHCANAIHQNFLDLGFAPLSNGYRTADDLNRSERHFPLRVKVCDKCWLVQTEDFTQPREIFGNDYAYFSSTSSTWRDHVRLYCKQMTERFGLGSKSQVVEIGSNDGYLLRNFIGTGVGCLGIEPTTSTAAVAKEHGIEVVCEFFEATLANRLREQGYSADLVIANNVYAHVPDINDFTRGLAQIVKPNGVITLEFPHLLQLIRNNQFDTVYHEHFSYLSLTVVENIFKAAGLRVWDVEQLNTHGGSLRVFGCRANAGYSITPRVQDLLELENNEGLSKHGTYANFQAHAEKIKDELLTFLIQQKKNKKQVVAYGAAAKGNTLLNYAGVKPDLLTYVCDAAVAKQGKYMPGSHIPIVSPATLRNYPPEWVLILPWNISDEVCSQLKDLRRLGTKFVTAIPKLRIL